MRLRSFEGPGQVVLLARRHLKDPAQYPYRGPGVNLPLTTLSGFYNLSCFQAASANLDSLRVAGHEGPHALKIRIEAAVGSVVRVADAVPKLGPLATYVTAFCHCSSTSYEKNLYEDKSEV